MYLGGVLLSQPTHDALCIVEESEKAEDLTTKRCAESPGSSVTTISTSAKEQNTTQQLTEINCPDCGVSVVLSDLTSHLQNECSNQYSASKKVCASEKLIFEVKTADDKILLCCILHSSVFTNMFIAGFI